MLNRLFALRGTNQSATTFIKDFSFFQNRRVAGWATAWHDNDTGRRIFIRRHYPDDFWYDIACPAHNHRIANAQSEPFNFVHIMQGGITHRDAPDKYWFESRHWCYGPCSAHLKFDTKDLSRLFLCGKFVGHCPSRRTGVLAEFTLNTQFIDFNHRPVDFIIQRVAFVEKIQTIIQAAINPSPGTAIGINRQPPGFEQLKNIAQPTRHLHSVDEADTVAKHL